MRLLSLLFIFLFIYQEIPAQCKTVKNPFSGQEETAYHLNNRSLFTYNHTSREIKLNFTVDYKGRLNEYMEKGSKIMFKLADGTILEFVSDREIAPVSEVHNQVYTYYTFIFNVSEQDLRKLASSKVVHMQKPDMKGGTVNINVKKNGTNFWRFFSAGAKCIVKNL
ncbi:hypothetical protein MQE36_09100 [Zhouia spongiae]|uniref:Uncharacterized protein n=1 Tax=Zhouia spongiae TaxID=2202721 RepID=A0ABY3YHY8_9FLAO|nr:hypothetical protein [Zhouia spongiae]UNY97254.1 hypothetical protein MQE36_09100 [Zhouia spongiae]